MTTTSGQIARPTTILFQGDSVTDAGRSYENDEILGTGYTMMTAAWYSATYPEKKVRFLNRGISGDRIRDLKDRWQRDCIKLRPAVVSILIGVNDALSIHVWNKPTPAESFQADYRTILKATKNTLDAQIVLLEPFALHVAKEHSKLREELDVIIQIVRELSADFGTLLIPLDKIFAEAAEKREPQFWSQDGVHPTLAGHALIAQSWMKMIQSVSSLKA